MKDQNEKFEIVKPTVVNDIEFYVSADGKQSGLSHSGLARLSGISRGQIIRLLTEIERLEAVQNTTTVDEITTASAFVQKDALAIHKGYGSDIYLSSIFENNAKVVHSKLVSRIIRYYAYHADKKSEVAQLSYTKFADMGIDLWIKDVTQFTESSDTSKLLQTMADTLNLLAKDVSEMKAQLTQTEGYRVARITLPGLKEWMESLSVEEYNSLSLPSSEPERLYTLTEWAIEAQGGLVLSKSNKHALANLVSATYKTMVLEMPAKVVRFSDKGYALAPVQAYPKRHFCLLSMCFAKVINSH